MAHIRHWPAATALLLSAWLPAAASLAAEPSPPARHTPDVVYVPTPHDVVEKMLEMAAVTKGDVLYDLGCGDGRIMVAAALRHGCRAVGFEIADKRVAEARSNIRKHKVQDLVKVQQKDIFEVDLRPASVITLYLLPSLNLKLVPQLDKLKPGSRIVSHDYDIEGVTPDSVVTMMSKEDNVSHVIYLWTTPLKKEKAKEKEKAK